MTGLCMSWNDVSPMKQSWPMRWTSSRRRLAAKPILRSSGRFLMRRPMSKSKTLPVMDVKISDHGPRRLQVGHVDIQVHSIDGFELQHDVVAQYVRHRSCYAHCGLRSSTGLAT